MYIVILAGGSGTRFWPLSRKKTPKQLMSVFGGKSMLQRTVERVLPLKPKRILVVTNVMQADETSRQLEYIKGVPVDIIAEPLGRNTAPAIGLAASIIAYHDPDGVMAVLPADHYITDEAGFCRILSQGRETAMNGYLVTLGITPTRPETGYGYIEAENAWRGHGPFPVKRFVEKPNREKALEFLEAGNFFWNSGMFLWKACTILDGISSFMPSLAVSLSKLVFSESIWELNDLRPQIETIYGEISGESIDFGVMEKADNVQVIPADFGWSDVGSWSAIPEVADADQLGHVVINAQEVISVDAHDCLVYGDSRSVALIGVRDLIVVNTPDALLVCPKERAQDVKKVVEELERRGLKEYL
ncbi:mannose-1-phosphate guanylyltransferase [Geotalea sp. SG265]|uniref:mannose-1-phosphate guanylyltransferase n=1 Tax=Geotalea sp. SG265 TaxID=2922867 RepID=UPI001FAFF179|nr:mannose-1-phosphate guanylyltransferase [Geotalea sp. SG265]